jgi:uncharacterized protein YacL
MSNSTKSNAVLVWTDIVTVVVLAVAMKLTSKWIDWSTLLDKDLYGILVSIVLAISFTAYAGLVLAVNNPRMQRLKHSPQFKNVLKILFAYMLAVIGAYLVQKLLNDYGLFAIATAFVVIYRSVRLYWKTLSLV